MLLSTMSCQPTSFRAIPAIYDYTNRHTQIPQFPEFVSLSYELRDEMYPLLNMTPDGVSEYTFANLYLFRKRYNYLVSRVPERTLIISGERDGKKFFMTPCDFPGRDILDELFATHDYWKGISESVLFPIRGRLEEWGIVIAEDRNNFDYLYLRDDLAKLAGHKWEKKRHLVKIFSNSYSHEERPLTADLVPDAQDVLERWRAHKGYDGDYVAAKEALDHFEELGLQGAIYYADGKPAGWCLGESLANGKMFAIHFEKGITFYKGIYQYISQTFSAALPRQFTHINREQDLGDVGMRQAKMIYHPCGFVRKYTARKEQPITDAPQLTNFASAKQTFREHSNEWNITV